MTPVSAPAAGLAQLLLIRPNPCLGEARRCFSLAAGPLAVGRLGPPPHALGVRLQAGASGCLVGARRYSPRCAVGDPSVTCRRRAEDASLRFAGSQEFGEYRRRVGSAARLGNMSFAGAIMSSEVDAMTQSAIEATRSRLSYSAIATYAEQIAQENGVIDDTGAVDVYALTERLGGQVAVDDRAESLEVRRPGDFTIFLPTHTSRLRDRFTIAHELGHYFLHYRAPERHRVGERVSTFTRLGRNVSETQANVFASNLLMPAEHFKTVFRRTGHDMVAVAQHFGVSVPAARVRAEYLGLAA
jgi:hypothetical protein